jgi:hypothetical protein
MLDIFKKDRTAYVQYIYAIIETRQGMVNAPHKKQRLINKPGMNALFRELKWRDLYEDKKIPDIRSYCCLPAGGNTPHTGSFR